MSRHSKRQSEDCVARRQRRHLQDAEADETGAAIFFPELKLACQFGPRRPFCYDVESHACRSVRGWF
jgi:hypothetical protein